METVNKTGNSDFYRFYLKSMLNEEGYFLSKQIDINTFVNIEKVSLYRYKTLKNDNLNKIKARLDNLNFIRKNINKNIRLYGEKLEYLTDLQSVELEIKSVEQYYNEASKKEGVLKKVDNFQEVMNYKKFVEIYKTYFLIASQYLIEGYTINLTNNLGVLNIVRVERNPEVSRINWQLTNKNRKINKDAPLSYYTDDEYPMIRWVNGYNSSKIKNITNYRFVIAAGDTKKSTILPMKFRLHKAMKDNPNLKLKYPFIRHIEKNATK